MKLPDYLYNMKLHKTFRPGEDTICYAGPCWNNLELEAAQSSLLSGKWLTAGEEVKKFEREFSKYLNQKYSTMVNSGSSANLVMLAALKKYFGWAGWHEIIVSASGFPTTVAPILQNELIPTFVDVEMDTLNFDLDAVEKAINSNTVAIFISPVLGNPPDMDRLKSIREEYGVELILDCCDSLGSKWKDKHLSELVVASSFSFFPSHHITCGEGGTITTNNRDIDKLIKSMTYWGRDCYCNGSNNLLQNGTCNKRFSKWLKNDVILDHRYLYTNIGYNLKPLDMQGAICRVQLKKLDDMNDKRWRRQTLFEACLSDIPGVKSVKVLSNSGKVPFFAVPIICETKELKDKLVRYFEDKKIQTRSYFAGNLLLHPAYSHLGNASDYTNASKVLETVLFIGCSPTFSSDMIDYICKIILEFRDED